MSFSNFMPNKVLMDMLGDQIIYHSQNGAVMIKAIVTHSIEPIFSGDSHLSSRRKKIDIVKQDVPGITKASKFTIDGITVSVDDIISDDGYVISCLVH